MRSSPVVICLLAVALLSACSDSDSSASTTSSTEPAPATTTVPSETTTSQWSTTTTGTGASADIVFANGVIHTQDPDLGTVEAVAVTGDRITAVGSVSEVSEHIGEETRVVDLDGRTVIPGFVDAHTHILSDVSVAEGQLMALENGITTVGEAFVNQERLDRLVASSESGQLRVRTSLYLVRTDNCGNDLGRWYEAYPPGEQLAGRVRVGGVKVFADGGTCGPFAVSEPFREGVPTGEPFATQEVMEGYISDADRAGYQLLIHAIGDLAIRQVMDAYESALGPGGGTELRHRIDHNSFLADDLVGRYGELGLVGVVFGWIPTCDVDDDYTEFWYETADNPARPIEANPDTVFAWHGDDPWIGPVNPLAELFGFVTRSEFRDGEICRASERLAAKAIPRRQALDLMTTGSAYALGREEEVGSLTTGKYADMVVLSDDLLEVEADRLVDITVLMTMIGGEVEHCVDSLCEPLIASGAEIPEGSGDCVTAPDGLTHWWTGDDGGADLAGDNPGELLGSTSTAPGVVDGAFRLRSSSIALETQPDLEDGFTIEGWVNFDEPMAPFQTVFNNNQMFVRKNPPEEGGGLAVFVKLEDGSVEPRAQSPSAVEPGVWTHFAATWDGSDLLLYVDGAVVGRAARSGRLTPTTVEARIGGGEQEGVEGNEMTGFVDELSIYDRALDPDEIESITAAGADGKCR